MAVKKSPLYQTPQSFKVVVQQEIATIVDDMSAIDTPIEAAFKAIARHPSPGTFTFDMPSPMAPGEDSLSVKVTVEYS